VVAILLMEVDFPWIKIGQIGPLSLIEAVLEIMEKKMMLQISDFAANKIPKN
jgi:hypothetical protein